MSSKSIVRILFFEDMISDYELAKHEIKKEGINFVAKVYSSPKDCLSVLKEFQPDIIISDYSMPFFTGKDVIKICQDYDPILPVIILTGSINEEIAVDCLKAGAVDYVLKEKISRLPYAVKEAIERKNTRLSQLKAEKELSEKNTFLESIFRSAPIGIGVIQDNTIFEVDETLCNMLYYKRHELINQNTRILFPTQKEYKSVINKIIGQINQTDMGSLETRFRAKNDKIVNVILSCSPIDLKDSQKGNTFTVVDITQRKKMELSLQESEQKYRSYVEYAPYGVFVTDENGRYIDVNPTGSLQTGYSKKELLTLSISNLIATNHKDIALSHFNKIKQDGYAQGDFQVIKANGSMGWFSISGVKLSDKRLLGFVEDITDYKIADEIIRRQSAVNATLSKLSSEMLKSEFDRQTAQNLVADSTKSLTSSKYGYISLIDQDTKKIDMVMHTQLNADKTNINKQFEPLGISANGKYNGLWGHSLNTRKPFFTNNPVKHPSYSKLPANHIVLKNFLAVPIIIEDELLGVIVLFNADRDYNELDLNTVLSFSELYGIFERDLRTKQLLAMKDNMLQQSQKMDAIGRLAGGVAHDFNNMLQAIIGYTNLALDADFCDINTSKHYLTEIKNASLKAAELTRQLLSFARKQPIKPVILDVNSSIYSLTSMLQRLIGENIKLIWSPGDNLTRILIDPTQFDQIITNIVLNARDAIEESGKIIIETKQVFFDKMIVLEHPHYKIGSFVCLKITDTGHGMDKETLVKIWEPFFTTKDLSKGTGLGLPIVYGIINQNEGFIIVESEKKQGTVINIYLPAIDKKMEQETKKQVKEAIPKGRETVLVVEDELMLLELAKTMLNQLEYNVLTAATPLDAIDLVSNNNQTIHLLVSDFILPDMNGQELYSRLLKIIPGLKCVFMSGYTNTIIDDILADDKQVGFLQKPFSIQQLALILRKYLD